MKIALAQLDFIVGHFEHNTGLMIDALARARSQGADLVVFTELAICGYPPRDLLEMDHFIDLCEEGVSKIASQCLGIAAIIGAPSRNPQAFGKRLLNSAFLLAEGEISATYHKGLLPTYDVFDEYRYFEPASSFKTINFKGKKIALTICEDLWNLDVHALYSMTPMDVLIREEPDLMINISASPFAWSHLADRHYTFSENARQYGLPLFVANQMGGHAELLFDGQSAVYNPQGGLVGRIDSFTEGIRVFDLEDVINSQEQPVPLKLSEAEKNEVIYQALVFGIRAYFGKLGLKKAILGLSGGLDSALTLVLAADALGPENCRAVLLPGPYSTDHSINDAVQLAQNLGVPFDIIPINETFGALQHSLGPYFKGTTPGVAEENLQARARAVILMGLANKFGYVLLNTSNKSEAAVGYGTLYGDMCGGLAVIGDIYKTEAYSLSQYINCIQEIIPVNILNKPPSAELKPDQRDTDSLPPYEILDDILFSYIEKKMSAEAIVAGGHPEELVKKVLRMVNANEYKRHQTPPILRVSKKAFGSGRKMPLVARFPE
ncbi:MAG: NAD+ synthase [Bacteroides sp.]|jgi:NAD+ synthase (glutamine-hydrolysing)|nr:NAD+ synthase [Bacteroides sp.]